MGMQQQHFHILQLIGSCFCCIYTFSAPVKHTEPTCIILYGPRKLYNRILKCWTTSIWRVLNPHNWTFQGVTDFHLEEMIICPNHTSIYSWCGFLLYSWHHSFSVFIPGLSHNLIANWTSEQKLTWTNSDNSPQIADVKALPYILQWLIIWPYRCLSARSVHGKQGITLLYHTWTWI